jgi:hypothetical protein
MPITDKNRKILWARSGSRCAFCRAPFVFEGTGKDPESVVAAECHIVSSAPTGPRHDPAFPAGAFDALDNLILLCATHHKMIDDQYEAYSAPVVRSIKQDHEKWVQTKLRDETTLPPVRIRRIRENIPTHLSRINSGNELMSISSRAFAHYFDHDQDLSEDEVELIGGFIQEITDWRDLSLDLEPIEQVRTAKRLHDWINELEASGFLVFAATEAQRIEGGVGGPTKFPVLHLSVIRGSNPTIQYVDPSAQPKA